MNRLHHERYIGKYMKKTTVILLVFLLGLNAEAAENEEAGFPGEDYSESSILADIPEEASTCAFPVSSGRAVHVENENARCIRMSTPDEPEPLLVYVINEDTAHLRLELPASDDPAVIMYSNNRGDNRVLQDLLDKERGAYVIDQPMPDEEPEGCFVFGFLTDGSPDDAGLTGIYLLSDDAYIETLAEDLGFEGHDITWEYVEPVPEEEDQAQAYVLHIVDQNKDPVPGVMVNFCTDTACVMQQSDEDGVITFDGAPDIYHIQILKVPEGFHFDPAFELYTDRVFREWQLRIQKD